MRTFTNQGLCISFSVRWAQFIFCDLICSALASTFLLNSRFVFIELEVPSSEEESGLASDDDSLHIFE
jgi:hypothetical protein